MVYRTFGWIQNPSSFENLHRVVSLFDSTSAFNMAMRHRRIPLLASNNLLAQDGMATLFTDLLSQPEVTVSYDVLKGHGAGGGPRANAKCSGIAQAAFDAQRDITLVIDGTTTVVKKPFTDDWTADGFLRWAVSLGFLEYHDDNDTCTISPMGRRLVSAPAGEQRDKVLGEAMLSYPPACRILDLLGDGTAKTKFELGRQLGFTTEAGFTSYPQNIWAYTYVTEPDQRASLRSNAEGSSDKYARMIAGWLANLGWVRKCNKRVMVSIGQEEKPCDLGAFMITAEGLRQSKHIRGNSSVTRTAKRVMYQMLATKAPDSSYLRLRRAHIITALTRQRPASIDDIRQYLSTKGIDESETTIIDDIQGLTNIGLDVIHNARGYHIADTIAALVIPADVRTSPTAEASIVKERVRQQLTHLPHHYLALIDYAYDGKSNRDFEIGTIDLFTNALAFGGQHLGGSRRPDGIIYDEQTGVIIDNKAYPRGYSIPISQADEMVRYIMENQVRDAQQNPNRWWQHFPEEVTQFCFAFIAPTFVGNFAAQLQHISQRTGISGGALNVEQLLLYAEDMARATLSRQQFLTMLNHNAEATRQQ